MLTLKFVNNWDEKFKEQINFLKKQGVKKPILSTYPNRDDDLQMMKNLYILHIYVKYYKENIILLFYKHFKNPLVNSINLY